MIKVNDVVNLIDGHYAFGIRNGRYVSGDRHWGGGDGESNILKNMTVIEIGISVMKLGSKHISFNRSTDDSQVCDLLVTDNNGSFWFVASRHVEIVT